MDIERRLDLSLREIPAIEMILFFVTGICAFNRLKLFLNFWNFSILFIDVEC